MTLNDHQLKRVVVKILNIAEPVLIKFPHPVFSQLFNGRKNAEGFLSAHSEELTLV